MPRPGTGPTRTSPSRKPSEYCTPAAVHGGVTFNHGGGLALLHALVRTELLDGLSKDEHASIERLPDTNPSAELAVNVLLGRVYDSGSASREPAVSGGAPWGAWAPERRRRVRACLPHSYPNGSWREGGRVAHPMPRS
jgi:hypothetical protein